MKRRTMHEAGDAFQHVNEDEVHHEEAAQERHSRKQECPGPEGEARTAAALRRRGRRRNGWGCGGLLLILLHTDFQGLAHRFRSRAANTPSVPFLCGDAIMESPPERNAGGR